MSDHYCWLEVECMNIKLLLLVRSGMSNYKCWLQVECMDVRPLLLVKRGMYEYQTITAGYKWNV